MSLLRSRVARLLFFIGSLAVGAVTVALVVRHVRNEGWPLHQANVWLVLLAGGLFFVAYGFKAWGWQRLFTQARRPRLLTLAAAGGAATVGGVALPGRLDEAIRFFVVRRCRGTKASVGAVALSLFLLGLLDSAALTPLASVAAALSAPSTVFRVGLALIAATGVAAAVVMLVLPRLLGHRRLVRFRAFRWTRVHIASPRDAVAAWLLVSVSWLLRGLALFVLLHALGLGASVPLALAVLCASAAAAAIPVAPAGAATQAGAGAAVLIATGVGVEQAVSFAVAAQVLVVVAGGMIVLAMGTDLAGARLRSALIR